MLRLLISVSQDYFGAMLLWVARASMQVHITKRVHHMSDLCSSYTQMQLPCTLSRCVRPERGGLGPHSGPAPACDSQDSRGHMGQAP